MKKLLSRIKDRSWFSLPLRRSCRKERVQSIMTCIRSGRHGNEGDEGGGEDIAQDEATLVC